MNIINGAGWQQLANYPLRAIAEASAEQHTQFRPLTAASGVAAQQQSRDNTARQNADDAREEAFAKLKVLLQNPDYALGETTTVGNSSVASSGAAEEFREYMALSPAEKIKAKLLAELGMSVEEFENLPPEEQEKIEEKIAEQMKQQTEMESLAALDAQMQAPALAANQVAPLTTAEGTTDEQHKNALQA
ncbi:hypothetical protein M2D63_022350 [Pseudomonas sp. BJa5]|uniref:hypothetical protein n=1 Tax=Pseudomonas sp. BJa5 TaxID=2936270 RepID=UPI002559829D|nr:hypothetical protein [Pseudomonas sp. BGr12]MDL2423859.1 hypothetical protein [Pseudomonas sp. BGr12]